MDETPAQGRPGIGRGDIARMLSPLAFFLAHLAYLVFWSRDPFLKKWIDGSFTFFVALVLCNIIRARIVGAADREDPDVPPGGGAGGRSDAPPG